MIFSISTAVEIVLVCFTCGLKPYDGGILGFSKSKLCTEYIFWSCETNQNLDNKCSLSVPSRLNVFEWMFKVWITIDSESIRRTFSHTGFGVVGSPLPSTPYHSTPFPYVNDSNEDGGDAIGLEL